MNPDVMVYYTLAMCMYSQVGVEEVLRWVLEEERTLFGLDEVQVATSGAISSARKRLGADVIEALYRRTAKPLATKQTKGAWHEDLRLVALDGSTLDLQDTPENSEHYGYAPQSRGECAFPKLRFVSLLEVGTRVLFGAKMAPYATGELALATQVIGSLEKGMLCLAERLFYSYNFWKQATQTGAELLWRVKDNLIMPEEESLADGSWLTTIYPDKKSRNREQNGMRVRVIEYRLEGTNAPKETYRLLTTLLDHERHPAATLTELYPLRWEIKLAYDEFKTHLRGGRVVLRSKKDKLVKQEFYAFLLAHFSAKQFMHEAALANDIEPNRLSFTHTIRVFRRKLPALNAVFSPSETCEVAPTNHP